MSEKREIINPSEKIELLSEEVHEIMGHVPPWIVRWGITVIFSVFVFLVAGSFVFKYPDAITATVVIVSENPSVSIVARTNGKIEKLLIKNGIRVKEGNLLAILENTANYNHVLDLKQKLDDFIFFFNSPIDSKIMRFPVNYSLGQVQSSFSAFQRQYEEYLNFLRVDMIRKKEASLKNQYKDYGLYIVRLKNQVLNQEKSLELTHKQFLRDSSLFRNGVIAAAEFEKSEQSFLQVKSTYQSLLASIANNQMQMSQLNYQIIDLESQQTDQMQSKINSLKESYDNLRAAIAEWQKSFVLTSPVDGQITFNRFWSKNQFVTTGETVFTVIPSLPQRIIGRAKIPVAGSGKVANGQRVLVRLDNFPYTEFGMLEGKMESMSLVPETNQEGTFYTAELSFPYGLKTNYKKLLPFNQEMYGSAEIITKNMNLFDRMFNPIKSAFNRYK